MEIEICRACMCNERNLIPLDEWFVNNYNLLTNLNVNLLDTMPQYSCTKCTGTVKHFTEFRENSISSEKALWNLLKIKSEEKETLIKKEEEIKNEITETNDNNEANFEDQTEPNCYSDLEKDGTNASNTIRKITTTPVHKYELENKSIEQKMSKNKSEIVKSKRNTTKKIKKNSENKNLYCGICTEYFKTKDDIKNHLETHKTKMQCGICNEDMVTWPQLFAHRLKHLSDKQKKCHFCDKRYVSPSSLEYHYLVAHCDAKEKVLTCKICHRTYSTPTQLRKHLAVHSDPKFFCDYCSKGFRIKSILQTHMVTHLSCKIYSCDQCKFTSRLYKTLRRHKISEHCPSKVKCKACRQYFENEKKLLRHICPSSVICPVCGLLVHQLTRHMRSHNSVGGYKCERCPATYKSKSALKAHLDRHDGNKTHACEHCPAKFYSGSSLIKHRRVHTGEKPYVCKLCKRGFTGNHNLKMHMRVHGQFIINKRNKEETTS